MNTRKVSSLAEVHEFVMACHAARFPDFRRSFESDPTEDEPATFEPLPADVAAEAKPEGRLVVPRRVNPHD